jgi:hypothetical protein
VGGELVMPLPVQPVEKVIGLRLHQANPIDRHIQQMAGQRTAVGHPATDRMATFHQAEAQGPGPLLQELQRHQSTTQTTANNHHRLRLLT